MKCSPRPYRHAGYSGRIGVARADITPQPGIYARNWGAAAHDTSSGVHRPLTATAVTIEDLAGGPVRVLVSLDLGWWRSALDERAFRGCILSELGLRTADVMISLTHTHAGPAICEEDFQNPGGQFIEPYLSMLRARTSDCIRRAMQSAEPALLEWCAGSCGLAANRDLRDPTADRYLSGFNPEGIADNTLVVGRVTTAAGQIKAILVNYACHPTTLAWQNALLSPDFCGAMRETIEGATPGALAMYLHGASGELAPREQYTDDVRLADRHGRCLGYAALSLIAGMTRAGYELQYAECVESGAPLALWRPAPAAQPETSAGACTEVEFALQNLPDCRDLEAELSAATDRAIAERTRRKLRIRRVVGGTTANMPLWVWRVGDAIFVGHPNEAYSNLQAELRARFPDRTIVVMNIVNGHFGYLPPNHLYNLDLYPVWQTPFAAGSLERLIDAGAAQIDALLNTQPANLLP